MGFTPNAGLMMGTRCGDTDISILTYMMKRVGLTAEQIDETINKKSGLLGISGTGSDNRDIELGISEGNNRCILARNMFARRIVEYISKYYVLMSGIDAICFTAGIGENSPEVRKNVIERLSVLGIKLDDKANGVRGEEALITANDSTIACYIVPTNEELMIARDTHSLVMEEIKCLKKYTN
jgi:acetate kinase